MTVETIQIVRRGVLKARSVNSLTPKKHSSDTVKPQNIPITYRKFQKIPVKEQSHAEIPVEESPVKEQTSREKFEDVLQFRVAEDLTGDLAEMGIAEWSVDDFEFVERLGSGASATVYRVKEKISGYHVALKVQEYDQDDISADVELDIHLHLAHSNVVTLIDHFFEDKPFPSERSQDSHEDYDSSGADKRYLIMILEVCDKGSLFDVSERFDGGWLDECDAVFYFWGCLEAMKYLHGEDILHCDIKTSNFLIGADNEVKLADFGMAVHSAELDILGGSPVYMAPEHLQAWRTGVFDFDHRVDIYGLGVVLFQILVGDLPYFVIETEEDRNTNSLLVGFQKLAIEDGTGFVPPQLDLRRLNDRSSDEAFDFPAVKFPHRISEQAKDLILRLMETNPSKRISLSEAMEHCWFKAYS